MSKSKQHLSETYARLFKGKPASNDRKLLREFDENESPFSRDGWNEEWFDDMGFMNTFDEVARIAYEIKNARRGSYATDGTLSGLANQFSEIANDFQGMSEEFEGLEDQYGDMDESRKSARKQRSRLSEAYARDSREGKALDKYFEELVPRSGKADTINGEIVRAVTRIGYRWYNDGDKFYEGYGAETAGPAVAFLTNSPDIDPQVRAAFARAESKAAGGYGDAEYEAFLQELFELALRHVETIPDKPTNEDMFDYDSDYEDDSDWDDEDDPHPYGYWDDEDDDY